MRTHDDQIHLSATDLAAHLGCRHLTSLDLLVAHGKAKRPVYNGPGLEALWERGLEHEREFLDHLRAQGREILELPENEAPDTGTERTIAAMREEIDVIAQGTLALDRWHGLTDVLLRVDTHSNLGSWSYEVLDTKLAREIKGGTILQLCLYSSLVEQVQGVLPEHMYVVTPGTDFESENYRVRDFYAYYNLVHDRLVDHVDNCGKDVTTYPEPCTQCDICVWWKQCDTQWRDDDHLCLVAGISKMQRRELESRDVNNRSPAAQKALNCDTTAQ